jgi:hypothetical protein
VGPFYHGKSECEDRLQIQRVAANILNMQSRIADKGWSSTMVVGRGAKHSSPLTKTACYEKSGRASEMHRFFGTT